MNALFCSVLASSLLLSIFSLPNNEQNDDDYGYCNKIDFISVEPRKNTLYTTKIIVKCSFAENEPIITFINVNVKNSRYPRGKNVFQSHSNKQAFTFSFEYAQTYSTLSSEDIFIIEMFGRANEEIEIPNKVYEPKTIFIKEEYEVHESSQNIAIYRRDEGLNYFSEKFVFTNMKKEFVLEKYRGVDLSNIIFSYIAPKGFPLSYNNPRLVIETHDDVFKKVGNETGLSYVRICPLTINKIDSDNKYCFHLVDQLYVNPRTLDMSSYEINGYIKTDYLYFPNPINEVETYKVRFMVDAFGANKYDFSYEFTITLFNNLMGICVDSSYCLSSEDTTADFEMGTIISR